MWGVYSLWGGGREISFCVGERGMDWGCFGDCVKIPFMSTYSYVYKWVTFLICGHSVQLLNVKLVAHHVTSRL